MIKISIAMATFNGSKFLSEQLESLANQKYLPSELVICDDGSTDETPEIVADFATAAPFPVLFFKNERTLGFSENFLKAASLCSSDWISFCDQDDVWLPNKLDDARIAIEQDSRPLLILQNAFLCEADLSHHNRVFPDQISVGYHPPLSQFGFWVWLGFLQTFHSSVLSFLLDETLPRNYFPGHDRMSHDKWTCMVANSTGGICVMGGVAALYRRHENALTGPYAYQSTKERIKKALNVDAGHYRFLSEVAGETADYLQSMAEFAPTGAAEEFVRASHGFVSIGRIQAARERLYHASSVFGRAADFTKILMLGGYVGHPMVSLGWRSAIKDFARVLGVIRTLRQKR